MPFNNDDGFIPRTFDQIKEEYKTISQNTFPLEDFSDYESSNLYWVHYADIQSTLELENSLVQIEEAFFSYLEDTQNQIRSSEVGTEQGLLKALHPFVNNQQVIAVTPEPGIIEIYGDFITSQDDQIPSHDTTDWTKIAQTIFDARSAGIFTQNTLGKTNTDPIPSVPLEDELNKIVPITDTLGNPVMVYFSRAQLTPVHIKIRYVPSNTDLQLGNSLEILAASFLEGMRKKDSLGNPLYGLGKDFEPQKYINVSDHPFASSFDIQWSTSPSTSTSRLSDDEWSSGVRPCVKGELLTCQSDHIVVQIMEGS